MDTTIRTIINPYLQLRREVDLDPLLLLVGRIILEQGTIITFITSLQELILQEGLLIIHQVFQTTSEEHLDLTQLFREAKVIHT